MKTANESKKTDQDVPQNTALLEGSEMGDVKIHENVVASLVRQAALEQEGVSRLAGSALVDDIANLVGSRRMQSRAITVELGEDGRVGIEIKLNLIFGFRIPDVAERVQKAVIGMVEETTGMTVTRVNVVIQEIEDPVVDADEDEVEAASSVETLPIN
ncbi:MAG: Asp23/Gls24 family envelope stress response protein [Lentisphaeria bacterium]|nr:Asp23/Gls24 family envelope stress response protein [Lentisphaeria bacterium]MBR2911176.1 Asp23/Gls24 family envelope stress response protein [Lentisphaeria bacterium]